MKVGWFKVPHARRICLPTFGATDRVGGDARTRNGATQPRAEDAQHNVAASVAGAFDGVPAGTCRNTASFKLSVKVKPAGFTEVPTVFYPPVHSSDPPVIVARLLRTSGQIVRHPFEPMPSPATSSPFCPLSYSGIIPSARGVVCAFARAEITCEWAIGTNVSRRA